MGILGWGGGHGRSDTELEKALGPQANEDIEKELQTSSKSTRISCLQGPAVFCIQRGQNKMK